MKSNNKSREAGRGLVTTGFGETGLAILESLTRRFHQEVSGKSFTDGELLRGNRKVTRSEILRLAVKVLDAQLDGEKSVLDKVKRLLASPSWQVLEDPHGRPQSQ